MNLRSRIATKMKDFSASAITLFRKRNFAFAMFAIAATLALSVEVCAAEPFLKTSEKVDIQSPKEQHADAVKFAKSIAEPVARKDAKAIERALSARLQDKEKDAAVKTILSQSPLRLSRIDAYWTATPQPFYICSYEGASGDVAICIKIGKAGTEFKIDYAFIPDNA